MNGTDYQMAADQLLTSIVSGAREVDNRGDLRPMVPIRLFQVLRLMAMGRELENFVGGGARALVYQAGKAVGEALGGAVVSDAAGELDRYVASIQEVAKTLSIGLVVPTRVDLDQGELSLRVDECVSCAGIQQMNAPICHFEAGMVGGIVRVFLGREVKATETKCNAVGDTTCLIDVKIIA